MRRVPKGSLTVSKNAKSKFALSHSTGTENMEVPMSDFKRGDTASWDTEQVRRSQQAHHTTARRRRRKRINPLAYILFVLVISAILAGVGWLLMSDLCAFNRGTPVKVTVEVTADDTVSTVADKLCDAGLIKYKWFFKAFAGISHAKDKIGMGTYELNTDMDYNALITGMRSSAGNMNAETVRVTIPEGYTVAETIKLLAKNNVSTEEALLEAAQTYQFDYSFIDNNSTDISRLEGYLFPDTYEFYTNMKKPGAALAKMISNFNSKLDDDMLSAAQARGYDLKKIVTIASLIEKETDGTDQGKIASVIYNRLEGPGDKGGTYGFLQIDAALLYALPDHNGVITNEDKAVDSPYNLYKYAGLPPTPIANPGLKAIQAALNPETTDYYYYALGKDKLHHYSATLQEHNSFLNSGDYIGN